MLRRRERSRPEIFHERCHAPDEMGASPFTQHRHLKRTARLANQVPGIDGLFPVPVSHCL
jgi:hypothetical protein